jgi:hypothetical protein
MDPISAAPRTRAAWAFGSPARSQLPALPPEVGSQAAARRAQQPRSPARAAAPGPALNHQRPQPPRPPTSASVSSSMSSVSSAESSVSFIISSISPAFIISAGAGQGRAVSVRAGGGTAGSAPGRSMPSLHDPHPASQPASPASQPASQPCHALPGAARTPAGPWPAWAAPGPRRQAPPAAGGPTHPWTSPSLWSAAQAA